jgi:hypothetical protein
MISSLIGAIPDKEAASVKETKEVEMRVAFHFLVLDQLIDERQHIRSAPVGNVDWDTKVGAGRSSDSR